MMLNNLVDATLEWSVVGSFTRIGFLARRRMNHWERNALPRLDGKIVVITGGTSGLGLVTTQEMLLRGAQVTMLARNPSKATMVCQQLKELVPNAKVDFVQAEMGNLGSVRAAALSLQQKYAHINVLIHNAGALDAHHTQNADGVEQTVASHVLGPFLLTRLLTPQLTADAGQAANRVLWVSSGGMYAQPLAVESLEMTSDQYDGSTAYARAKRAQVALVELMAPRMRKQGIVVHAMHPGWADTPGVARSLPTFQRVVGRLLRTPQEGADTLIWLAACADATNTTGQFWHDRRVRSVHRGWASKRADTDQERTALWAWAIERSGCGPW
jgi:dehydrogenase/reductase SDR family member 12